MKTNIRCKSGLRGWQGKLHEVYLDYDQFNEYCAIYSIHERLGYKTPWSAWRFNPTVQGSVNPSDLRRVPTPKLKRYPRSVVIAHARKMNTKANARKLAQVDSGHYTIPDMDEQQRRDEKNGLYGGREDVAN